MSPFYEANVRVLIATALVLIVIFLMYIAFKLSDKKKVSTKSKN